MNRHNIIETIGKQFLTSNIEKDEFSYPKAFKEKGLSFIPIKNSKTGSEYKFLDIRFESEGVTVLVETKGDFTLPENKDAEEQLSAYVEYEKHLTGNKIVAILANTKDARIRVYRGVVSDENFKAEETAIRTMEEYIGFYTPQINDKEKIMKNTCALNELLHKHSIPEKIRSQFVGTCLLALKNGLDYSYPGLSSSQINTGIRETLEKLLTADIKKAEKLALLSRNVLENQNVRALDVGAFREILEFIDQKILPFINDKSTAGQDLLNLFFITFNKYVGKADKNQAFTPDHITDFMVKITGVNYHSRVLDPCCGSGSFLVRAMTAELDDCPTAKDQEIVKKDHIFGIEYEENVFGLATTNMLIHGDGKSNIMNANCFNMKDWIMNTARPDIIITNVPFNCARASHDPNYVITWKTSQIEDPSKGFYFAKWLASVINEMESKAKLAIILPVACAIGTSSEISKIKHDILKRNTLDAVFTLPAEIFYPGASASACCMVFNLGIPHEQSGKTFFGYYKEDGFKKKKNLGRLEQEDSNGKSKWQEIEKEWIYLYQNREAKAGLSAVAEVTGDDEWLCEAYMETDYSQLTDADFQKTVNDYLAFLVKNGEVRND